MSVGKSMKDFEKQKVERVSETDKNAEKATRVKNDIDEVYKTLEALPEGLDQEITDQIVNAEKAAQDEAGKDGDELKAAQERTNQEFRKLCGLALGKIKDNDAATKKLNGIRGKYGKAEIRGAISEIDRNTELGQNVISESEKAMNEIEKCIQAMRDKINKK